MGKIMKTFEEWNGGNVLYVMRGVSGSGKSYTAKQILASHGENLDPAKHIFSTDDYFGSGEEYKKNWSADKLGTAHGWNFWRFKDAIHKNVSPIIIDNTNTRKFEFEKYVEYARQFGYRVEIKESESPWWKAHSHMLADKQKYAGELENFAKLLASKNTHGVPLENIKKMIDRWEIA
jgi:hypothetical protein